MLSIIICSINPDLLNQVSDNIQQTVGVEFEIIVHDNRNSDVGICEVYNLCAEKSRFENLCFIHEDILFKTQNWGQSLISILNEQSIGLVGVAGNTVKSKAPSPWWLNTVKYRKANIYHVNDNNTSHFYFNSNNDNIADVVTIDGVFLSCRKDVWQKNKFDSVNFPRFHSYDIDFSLQIIQNYRACVTYNIDIEHFSTGSYNKDWINSVVTFSEKWKKHLPVSSFELSKNERKIVENEALTIFLTFLLNISGKKFLSFRYLVKKLSARFFDRNNILFVKRFIRKFFK